MGVRARLAALALRFKREARFYQAVYQHPQTPRLAKVLLWMALGYLVLPFDLIPDFIPVIGQLDELVVIPLLVYLAIRLTPVQVMQACREAMDGAD